MRTVHVLAMLPLGCFGCVIVNPAEVHMAGSPIPSVVVGRETPARSAYGEAHHRVIRQEERVARELQKRDWDDMLDEVGDWIEYTRTLSGYADMVRDRERFRRCCDDLLAELQALRAATMRCDAAQCECTLRSCDPLLDTLSRDFNEITATALPTQTTPPPARRPIAP